MTPSLLCCQSGSIDNCGVCDGDGSACQKVGISWLNIATSTAPPARKLTQVSALGVHKPSSLASVSSDVQQADVVWLDSQTIHASHARGVLAVGSQHAAIVAEFETCVCTSLKLQERFESTSCVCSWFITHCPHFHGEKGTVSACFV